MKVYVASSWRNTSQPVVVARLQWEGYEVYDFRRPTECSTGFHWSEIDPAWEELSPLYPNLIVFRDQLEKKIFAVK